jgi:transmembrane sensor
MAAAGLAAALSVVILQPAISVWLRADYSTGVAETRQIRLQDGSIAFLGADSAIEVAYDASRRRIRLLSGQAYFEVQKDSARPFHVEAGTVDTVDLGTAFDVRLRPDGVSVAVNQGSVAVTSPVTSQALATPLVAGDWVRVEWGGAVRRGTDAPELAGGWRSGMLAVKDEAITDVIDEIGRHYRGKIIIASGELGAKRVTGVYDLKKPVDAIHAVAQALGAHARQVSPWLIVVSGS